MNCYSKEKNQSGNLCVVDISKLRSNLKCFTEELKYSTNQVKSSRHGLCDVFRKIIINFIKEHVFNVFLCYILIII